MTFLDNFTGNIDASALVIATVGALFSIASALYLTSRKIAAEMRYRRIELTNLYSENVLKQRLQAYPEIWSYVSEYEKIIHKFPSGDGSEPSANRENLLRFNCYISEWDNKYGILLSIKSAISLYRLRVAIRKILYNNKDVSDGSLLSKEECAEILRYGDKFEITLRTDVGIYEIDKSEGREIFKDYDDVISKTLGTKSADYEVPM